MVVIHSLTCKTMKSVVTTQAPIPIGPYRLHWNHTSYSFSQAIKHNGILYLSGNIGFAPGTTKLVDDKDVEKQTHQIFKNIGAILKEAGSGFDKVIKVTVFITDMAHFHAMNGVYQQCKWIWHQQVINLFRF